MSVLQLQLYVVLYGYHPVVVKVVSNFLGCIQLSVPLAQYEREIYYFCTVNSTFGVFMPCMIFCVSPPTFSTTFIADVSYCDACEAPKNVSMN